MRLLALSLLVLAGCPQQRAELVGADVDGDGFHSGVDCNDEDDAVSPGATEVAYNGVDDDCDSSTPDDDIDADGFAAETDCDDADPKRFPGAAEVCNGLDDDCDIEEDEGLALTWYADDDADGYGDPDTTASRCDDGGGAFVRNDLDCDDGLDTVHPGADEECNGADDDCDGVTDADAVFLPTWYQDADGDLFGNPSASLIACTQPGGYVANHDDCDDTVGSGASDHPGGVELCNGDDDDCDGAVDVNAADAPTWYFDHDDDGYGVSERSVVSCTNPDPTQWADNDDDCWDFLATAHPGGTEVCNGIDDDCDNTPDDAATDRTTWYADADSDGFGNPAASALRCDDGGGEWVANSLDCDDTAGTGAAFHPGAAEVCNGVDDDCNDLDDDVPTAPIWYEDFDEDGFGDPLFAVVACEDPSEAGSLYVDDATDCDDVDETVHPNATETCDEVDQDCDGLVDDGAAPLLPWYLDADGDDHGDPDDEVLGCSAPTVDYVADGDDCDDDDADINPDEVQACSTVDTNCDEAIPTPTACTWGTTCLDVLQEFPSFAGTDQNFLLDPEGNGSPVQYLCDMTTTGSTRPGAGWTRILSNNFEDSSRGAWRWDPSGGGFNPSDAVVTTCTATGTNPSPTPFGKILTMPDASNTAGGVLFQTFAGLPHDEVWVHFDYLMIDGWDSGAYGYLSTFVEPDAYEYLLWAECHDSDGTPCAPASDVRGCAGAGLDRKVTVEEHGATLGPDPLEIRIGSTLDEDSPMESFGLDNIEIWIR